MKVQKDTGEIFNNNKNEQQMTHTQTMRNQYANNKIQVQQILNWTPLQYAEYQEQIGYDYLRQCLQVDEYNVKLMTYEAMYWKWWINTWNIIDDQLLHAGFHINDYQHIPNYNELLYKETHKATYIHTSPLAVHFDNTYAKMIGYMHKNHTDEPVVLENKRGNVKYNKQ
jgi:hypothetical protein